MGHINSENITAEGISKLVNIFSKTEEPSIIDEVGGGVIYIGFSKSIGNSINSPLWKIKKITESGTITTIQYADGDTKFDNIWANRASLTYL